MRIARGIAFAWMAFAGAALGCGATQAPPAPPSEPPAADAGGPRECKAGPDECCRPDGTIVKATCDPLDNGPRRGEGGWCAECNLRCLPPRALIATPGGDRAVSTLRSGDLVWTLENGRRVARPIERIRFIPAVAHVVLRVTLADGRVVAASPGHPTADDRTLGALLAGDTLDGATVVSITPAPLEGDATWDLRPSGPTGVYWADGVLLASTLAP